MILQALVQYYEDQITLGKISKPGWSKEKVSFALRINDKGELIDVIDLRTEVENGKRKVLVPREMILPAPHRNTSGIVANFLFHNSSYFLGIGEKKKAKIDSSKTDSLRNGRCYEKCRDFHKEILSGCNSPAAIALLQFFQNWKPEIAEENLALKEYWDEIVVNGANLIFRYKDQFIHEVTEIGKMWDERYMQEKGSVECICLVTGKRTSIEAVHPVIKDIKGAHKAGASIVTFNESAFCSYGKKQNYNAPTSKYAAFAYTTALNTLISDRENVHYIGDTVVLCWVEGGEDEYRSFVNLSLFGTEETYSNLDIMDKIRRISEGKKIEFYDTLLDPQKKFYVLGIAPNKARLSVRFFWQNSFGDFVKHIEEHYQRLEIIKPNFDKLRELTLGRILRETVRQNFKEKESLTDESGVGNKTEDKEKKAASSALAEQLLEAILTNGRYPVTLINSISVRIKADHKMNRCRAAIIKAYYLKKQNNNIPEEVLTVALNCETTNVPYNLGRLFSILENIQQTAANSEITTTITDKYFNSASAMPATVFPILLNLAQKHLRKIGGGLQVNLSKEMQEVIDKLGEEFPRRMNLEQQGAFQLGYYHQTQNRYLGKNKEEK